MLATVLITAIAAVMGTLFLCGLFLWIMVHALARRMFGRF